MKKKLNISKEYVMDKSYEASFKQLDTIASASFNDPKFSTFGNYISAEPPEFIFMAKWSSVTKPSYTIMEPTKIFAKLYRSGDKSKISIVTKTDLRFFIFLFFAIAGVLIKLLSYKNSKDLRMIAVYVAITVGIIAFDRFIKRILITSFERDLKVK